MLLLAYGWRWWVVKILLGRWGGSVRLLIVSLVLIGGKSSFLWVLLSPLGRRSLYLLLLLLRRRENLSFLLCLLRSLSLFRSLLLVSLLRIHNG